MTHRLIEAADNMIAVTKLHERVAELEALNEHHRKENGKLREVVRQQGEFIQSMREMIRDFVYGEDASLGRLPRGRR